MKNYFHSLTDRPDPVFFLIAGPCVIESYDITYQIAHTLKTVTDRLHIPLIFKASFDKANRTSIQSYRGPGFDKGLDILDKIKKQLDIPVISDIHLPDQAEKAAQILDVIQIPAFLCRQTDLILSACRTGLPVNIKKGQFLAPHDCRNILNKAKQTGNPHISITERGSSFGYNNLVVDFRSIPIIKFMGVPVIFDATHSVQLPGGATEASSGERQYVPVLAKAAIAAGADGIFMETHPDPEKALCDGPNSFPLNDMETLLSTLLSIKKPLDKPMAPGLADIHLLLLDVDGVLTDGSITYSDSGEQIKTFNSRDGLGLRLLMDSGIKVGIITGRISKALGYRCKNLGITLLFDDVKDKSAALEKIILETGISAENIAFVGDDLPDLPVMTKVGFSFCVSDAPEEVKQHSQRITGSKGGQGAVREVCESILKARGLWGQIMDQFLT